MQMCFYQSNPGWRAETGDHSLPLSCIDLWSASASSLSAISSGRASSRPSAPYASRAHSGSSASDRKRVSVPVVPIRSKFFFRSIEHYKKNRTRNAPRFSSTFQCIFVNSKGKQKPCNSNWNHMKGALTWCLFSMSRPSNMSIGWSSKMEKEQGRKSPSIWTWAAEVKQDNFNLSSFIIMLGSRHAEWYALLILASLWIATGI